MSGLTGTLLVRGGIPVQGGIPLPGSRAGADSATFALEKADREVREPVPRSSREPLEIPTHHPLHRHHRRDVSLRVTSSAPLATIPAASQSFNLQKCLRAREGFSTTSTHHQPQLRAEGEGGSPGTTEAATEVAPDPHGMDCP